MAKGGSGDVLSGYIAGLASYSKKILEAACIGTFVLGVSAELVGDDYSLTPSDVIDGIHKALDEIINGDGKFDEEAKRRYFSDYDESIDEE